MGPRDRSVHGPQGDRTQPLPLACPRSRHQVRRRRRARQPPRLDRQGRAARLPLPRGRARGARRPSQPHLLGRHPGQGALLRAPRPDRQGPPPGRLGRGARRPGPRGQPGQPDPVDRAHRAGRRRRDRPLPPRGDGPVHRPRRPAAPVLPASHPRGRPGDRAPRALRRPPDGRARPAGPIKRAGGKDTGACMVLVRELEVLAGGSSRPTSRSSAPSARAAWPPRSASPTTPTPEPTSPAWTASIPTATGATRPHAWPMRAEEHWGYYRTDGAVHATYWIAEWPRIDVGAAFLSPLLLQPTVRARRGHHGADLAAEGDPRGRGRPDRDVADSELRANWASSRPPSAATRPTPSPAARRSSPTATPTSASPATSPSPPTAPRPSRALRRDRARRPDGPARAPPLLRPAGGAFTYTLPLCRGLK